MCTSQLVNGASRWSLSGCSVSGRCYWHEVEPWKHRTWGHTDLICTAWYISFCLCLFLTDEFKAFYSRLPQNYFLNVSTIQHLWSLDSLFQWRYEQLENSMRVLSKRAQRVIFKLFSLSKRCHRQPQVRLPRERWETHLHTSVRFYVTASSQSNVMSTQSALFCCYNSKLHPALVVPDSTSLCSMKSLWGFMKVSQNHEILIPFHWTSSPWNPLKSPWKQILSSGFSYKERKLLFFFWTIAHLPQSFQMMQQMKYVHWWPEVKKKRRLQVLPCTFLFQTYSYICIFQSGLSRCSLGKLNYWMMWRICPQEKLKLSLFRISWLKLWVTFTLITVIKSEKN